MDKEKLSRCVLVKILKMIVENPDRYDWRVDSFGPMSTSMSTSGKHWKITFEGSPFDRIQLEFKFGTQERTYKFVLKTLPDGLSVILDKIVSKSIIKVPEDGLFAF